jgi:hypothetical protein
MGNNNDTSKGCLIYDSDGVPSMKRLSPLSPSPAIYKVKSLKYFIQHLDSYYQKQLLPLPVATCNYQVGNVGFFDYCCKGTDICLQVDKLFLLHVPNNMTLQQHFSLLNLTYECEIGITQEIQDKLSRLFFFM